MNKNIGVVSILSGIGFIALSLLFSTGSHPRYSFFQNLSQMEVVFNEGKKIEAKEAYHNGRRVTVKPAHYRWRVSLPLKHALALGVITLLSGVGITVLSEKENSSDSIKERTDTCYSCGKKQNNADSQD